MTSNPELNQLISSTINIIIIPLMPVITAFIIAFIKKKTAELDNSIKSKELTKYIELAENAIVSSVSAVNQIYVDSIKAKNGFLSSEEQRIAFNLCKEKVLRILGEKGVEALSYLFNDSQTWINNRIEYHVSQSRYDLSKKISV